MNWSGVPCRRPLSASGCSRLRMVPLASVAISGTALTNETSCTIRMGTRIRKARVTIPANTRKVMSIANHRGMRWDSQRTGNERTSASAKPPSRTIGTVGAAHMRSASVMRPSTTKHGPGAPGDADGGGTRHYFRFPGDAEAPPGSSSTRRSSDDPARPVGAAACPCRAP